MEREMTVKTIMNIVILGLGIFLLKMNATPESMAIAYALGSGVGCLAIIFIIRNDLRKLYSRIDKKGISANL